jgi:hypothetical protein
MSLSVALYGAPLVYYKHWTMLENLKGTNTLAYFSTQSVAMRVFIMLAPCINDTNYSYVIDSGTVLCSTCVLQILDYI